MVLWELTLATAYVLGLPRTYRIALKLQRKLLGRHSRVAGFTYRRTRGVFGMALRVHKEIESRDISVGKSLGNWMLRFLARMQPSKIIHRVATGKSSNISHMSSFGEMQCARSVPQFRAYTKHVGSRFRNKLTVGLDRLKPDPYMRPVSSLALKLWWHPVRSMLTSPQQGPGVMLSQSSSQLPHPLSPLTKPYGGTRSVFRSDILQWMQLSTKS
ncbi:hypothetical protein O6H91_08G015700 [Diphasiastrum complanatum]|uniref:Uncharacterized protein n=1 Tax=Diphasiastrum complanatum TaxID=34168 RepID=A0ACC2CVJ0_DIPCM|nr:hypothetical protein O6H91_08G015700 [Diphasiastrum complanatum]